MAAIGFFAFYELDGQSVGLALWLLFGVSTFASDFPHSPLPEHCKTPAGREALSSPRGLRAAACVAAMWSADNIRWQDVGSLALILARLPLFKATPSIAHLAFAHESVRL